MKKIIIVGAGPAGATAAYLFAKHGIHVVLIEKASTFDRVFRGEALMPLGLDALKELGLLDEVFELPNRHINSWDMYVGNKQIFQVFEPKEDLGYQAVRVVSQPAYLEMVTEKAQHFDHFELRMNTPVRDLIWENGRVVGVKLRSGEEIQADYVLGCDGRGSLVRSRADIKLNLLPESYDILWFKFPAPKQRHGSTDVMFMGSIKHTALCYNSWDNQMRYALMLPKGTISQNRNRVWFDSLCEPAPAWLQAHLASVRDEISKPDLLNVIVGRASAWSKPGLLLIGDAAHPMSPIRAQGINLALRDVISVANHIIPALKETGDVDKAATAVSAERLPEIERAQQLQLREAQGQGNERLRPLLINIAKATGPLFGRFEWAKKSWLNQQKELRFGTVDIQLKLSE
ncbi:MAG: FAD-dependent monooxygenase [Chloroflexota bacterium]